MEAFSFTEVMYWQTTPEQKAGAKTIAFHVELLKGLCDVVSYSSWVQGSMSTSSLLFACLHVGFDNY